MTRYKLISCEIFYREVCALVARSPRRVDVEFLPKGLHDLGTMPMRERLQAAIDRVDALRYEAVLLGYALCNNGTAGLVARDLPLVLPRAHDCIALFFGCRKRYQRYFEDHPGAYYLTTGWMERGGVEGELGEQSIPRQIGLDRTLEDFIAQYGEDNGTYLYSMLGNSARHYDRYTYIAISDIDEHGHFQQLARQRAEQRGWAFETVPGNLSLLRKLIDGAWDPEDFLVVPPGKRVAATHDDEIVRAEDADRPAASS